MNQSTLLEQPLVLLVATREGLRERLSGRRLVDPGEADRLDEAGRAAVRVAVLSSRSEFTAADMDRYPNLGLIVTVGAGAEGVDAAAADARGIRIATGAGANSEDVADVAVGLFIGVTRRLLAGDARVRQGAWRMAELHTVRSISAYKVGIMGMGSIGRAVAHRLAPFRCQMAWTGPNPKPDVALPYFAELSALAAWADALIIAAPLKAATAGAVDRAVIDALGPQGVIVNVGRGGIIDEDQLIAALKDGRLAAAGLDVFAEEPTPPERWRDVPNTLLSPHTAAVTHEVFEALVDLAARHVADFLGPVGRGEFTGGAAGVHSQDSVRPMQG